ncbi:MAG TPA: SAF domain-containing protein [Acidimicrobiales bacterium]|nr:SAF domain-containing protein [Acidimicrobiales bacterium]
MLGRTADSSTAGLGEQVVTLARPRVVRRSRRGVNLRALLGGLLVAAAGVGTFATYSGATADHRLSYVVAAHQLVPGQRIGPGDLTTARMQLPTALADYRVFRDTSRLVGAIVVSPVASGELVQASAVVAGSAAAYGREISFAIDPSRAVDGSLQPGETVEVLATFGSGSAAVTAVVVPLAHVVSVDTAADNLGSRGSEDITLGLDSDSDVVALVNAVNAGQLELVRNDHPAANG